ncbi:MAG TPA: hypothetical protein VK402_12555 [Blastococcus sp.]|nr:hypothetical protein [Blastococcus sp.]
MDLVPIGDVDLTYTSIDLLAFAGEGQIYGGMEGTLRGDRVSGSLRLTNLARRRPDDINLPTLRGVLTTEEGASVWVELDGIATLRPTDSARVFVTACRFRTGSEPHAWLNDVVGVLEGVLDSVGVGGRARGRIHECRPTLT